MPKPIPPPTVAASVPPDRTRIYFEECPRFPFSPRAKGFDLCNAWWMAEASSVAYDTFDAAGRGLLDVQPLLNAGYGVAPGGAGDTQFVVIEKEDLLIVAFRGTRLEGFNIPFLDARGFAAHWGDIVTDARFLPKVIESDVFIHEGFLEAFRAIEAALGRVVESALADGRPVWFCGHSLGAALATIAAYKYRDRVQGLYTYGSPRVGNVSFVNTLAGQVSNAFRFVHHRDVVTTVPPEGLSIASNIKGWLAILNSLRDREAVGYAHAGQIKFITGQRTWNILDGESALNSIAALAADAFAHAKEVVGVLANGFSVTDPGSWPIASDAVADHSPVYYTNKIFNALEQSRA